MVTTTTRDDVYYDPYDREIIMDPYPIFRKLRDESPLYYNERFEFYAVSRFEDVERCLVDRARFQSHKGVILEMIRSGEDIPRGTLIHDEPPVHTIHRALLSRVFTPKTMLALEDQVREFCRRRLEPLRGVDRFDFVQDLGKYVPMHVFGMLLGIPEEAQDEARVHVESMMHRDLDRELGYPEPFQNDGHFNQFVDYRYEHPGDDLITRLITLEFEDETGEVRTLTRDEACTYVKVIAGAGNHTTSRLIGWTGKVLGEHPEQRRELVADRSLIPGAIEETLRFEPSATQIARYVNEDVELYGETIPAGSPFLCLVGSANRDERVFSDPDRYDIHRPIAHHLSFGYGPHFCLGAALARLEGRVVLDEVLNLFPDWEVDHDGLVMGTSHGNRGYDNVPVLVS